MMEVEYVGVPEQYLPKVKAMVEHIAKHLRLDISWDSLKVSTSTKIKADALCWVDWEIHHAHIKLDAGLLPVDAEMYRCLMHEFAHMVTWPWMEAIDHAVSHVRDTKQKRALKKQLVKDYERVNNELSRSLMNLIPWENGTHPAETSASNGESGIPSSL